MRVARYIDPTNITETFEEAVYDEPPENLSNASNIIKLHVGRLKATDYFFQNPELKKNRKIFDAVRALTDYHRGYLAHQLLIDSLKHDLKEAEKKGLEMRQHQDDQINKVAFTYTTFENPNFRPDIILSGGTTAEEAKMREAISLNSKLVRYIFCTDTVLDRDCQDAMVITAQTDTLRGVPQYTGKASSKKTPKLPPTSKHTPSKMDAERGG